MGRKKEIISLSFLVLISFLEAHLPFPFQETDRLFLRQRLSFEQLVLQRREEIDLLNEHWAQKLPENRGFLELLETGTLKGGEGRTYLLYDNENKPRYVIKPCDEELLCLHHKTKASPFNDRAVSLRSTIPPYHSAQTECLASELAHLLGLESVTPPTFLAVLSHPLFFDCNDVLPEPIGETSRNKLCSVQLFWDEIENLHDLALQWLKQGLTDEALLNLIDQKSFEDLYMFIWLIYDTDAHAGNLFAKKDERGSYHLCKLDNALSFPNDNRGLHNALFFLPQARLRPSFGFIQRLKHIPRERVSRLFAFYEREDAEDSFWQRVEKLLEKDDLSFRHIDLLF